MKRLIFLVALVLLIGSLFVRCKVFNPAMPVESYKYVPVKPVTSIINLHADFEVAKLEAIINSQMDSILYDDNSFEDHNGDNMILKTWKDGRITLRFENEELFWEIPLGVTIKKPLIFYRLNAPVVESVEATGKIKLKFKTGLAVNRDWSIKTSTKPNGYEWIKKPEMKIAGFTVPVTMFADMLLSFSLNNYSKKIDQAITESFDLRKYAEKGWQMMFNPFKIPGDYNAWLSLTPYSVSLMPVRGSNGYIQLHTAITTDVECLLDKQPQAGKVSALPSIQPLELPSDSFRINLLTDIPYSTIERIITESVGDSVYTFGKKKISFECFRVFGTNGRMAIETKVKGSINGTMYFTGMPVFNAADTTLRVQDLKFDIKTKNLLTNSAKWIFNGKIERMLTKAIAIPFNTNIKEVEGQLTGFFNHYPIGYNFEINGRLVQMSVSGLMLTPESVKANIVFSGRLALGIGEVLSDKKVKK